MSSIIRLWDEKTLLSGLQTDTLRMIQGCRAIPPVKKFCEAYDILGLQLEIQIQFPRIYPEIPEVDRDALIHLKQIVAELTVYHGHEVPMPDFMGYRDQVYVLVRLFGKRCGFEITG